VRELAEVVETLTAVTPLVVVLEDLHWSDYATLDVLALLAQRRAPARLLLLGTYRPVEAIVHAHPLRSVVQTLQQHGHCQELLRESLTAAEVTAYLHGCFGGGSRFPTTLAQAIYQRTEGNPLFMRTVVEALVRQGTLIQVGERWAMPEGAAEVALDVPDSLRPMIEQQFEQLSPAAQQVLEAASVAGMACTVAAVATALDAEESAVDDICATLARRGQFLGTSGQERWPDGTLTQSYKFLHTLYHDVIYQRTTLGRRQRLHQRLGAREEAGYGARAGERAAVLALHFARGGEARRAVHYLRQAGDNAVARSAYREAVACYEQALETVAQLPESRATREQAIDLRLALRNVLWTLGELGRLFVTLQEAEGLAEALGDPHRLGWVSLYLLAHFAQVGDPDRALAAGQCALALATTLGEMGLTVVAQHYLGGVYRSLGDYRRAEECFHTNVASLHSALGQERLGLLGLAAVFARSHLVITLAECGAFTEGRGPPRKGSRWPRRPNTPIAGSWPGGPWAFGRCARATFPRRSVGLNRPVRSCRGRTSSSSCPWSPPPRGRRMPSPAGLPTPCRCWSRQSRRLSRGSTCGTRHSGWCGSARPICARAGWTRRGPRRSAPSSSPGRTRNGAMKPTPCGSSVRARRIKSPQRVRRPRRTTTRPSPCLWNSACAHSWLTATRASARCMPRPASRSRLALPWPLPSHSTRPWT
jgi:tetratricopeptide (TPR) repeat protein